MQDWKATIDRWGLKVYCVRCQARGKFFPATTKGRYRLREVRCAQVLSDGETICGGRLRMRPRDTVSRDWPGATMPYDVPQLELGRRW